MTTSSPSSSSSPHAILKHPVLSTFLWLFAPAEQEQSPETRSRRATWNGESDLDTTFKPPPRSMFKKNVGLDLNHHGGEDTPPLDDESPQQCNFYNDDADDMAYPTVAGQQSPGWGFYVSLSPAQQAQYAKNGGKDVNGCRARKDMPPVPEDRNENADNDASSGCGSSTSPCTLPSDEDATA